MKLLRPFTGTGSVFFPIGYPPNGTCEFATEECYRDCYMADPSDFDEETRVTYSETWDIYEAVTTDSVVEVRDRFLEDLDGLQTNILSWFGSGDCQTKDMDRITALINLMPERIVQMGFTRNRELWERHKDVFALTVQDQDEMTDQDALYSIPDYQAETSVMHTPDHEIRGGFCGPILCQDRDRTRKDLSHYINCKTCHRLGTGCFDRKDPQ